MGLWHHQMIRVLCNRKLYASFTDLLLGVSIFGSGQEVGPLLLKVPLVAEAGFSTKNWWKDVSDKSHVFGDSERIIDLGCGSSRRAVLTDSPLLNEVAVAELPLSFSLSFTHLL